MIGLDMIFIKHVGLSCAAVEINVSTLLWLDFLLTLTAIKQGARKGGTEWGGGKTGRGGTGGREAVEGDGSGSDGNLPFLQLPQPLS